MKGQPGGVICSGRGPGRHQARRRSSGLGYTQTLCTSLSRSKMNDLYIQDPPAELGSPQARDDQGHPPPGCPVHPSETRHINDVGILIKDVL